MLHVIHHGVLSWPINFFSGTQLHEWTREAEIQLKIVDFQG